MAKCEETTAQWGFISRKLNGDGVYGLGTGQETNIFPGSDR